MSETKIKVDVLLIDFGKAPRDREKLYTIIKELGVPKKIIKFTMTLKKTVYQGKIKKNPQNFIK